VVFATHALSPAKVSRITVLDPIEKHMEVIVDDSQLSLAIGKKGQNVRLAAKLLGWKIDIKSEEEKRQEVESQMAALVAPGAPVSVLIEYGLSEAVAGKLVEAGVGTIEKLGSMTPEELEAIQGIGVESVDQIQQAVNAYYSQFEEQGQAAAGGEQAVPEPEIVPEAPAEAQAAPEAVPDSGVAEQGPEASAEPAQLAPEIEENAEQSGRMEDAGPPTQQLESAGSPDGDGPQGVAPGGE
jgi:N utilization substance protein A